MNYLQPPSPVKLNLACGTDYKPNPPWVNLDVVSWPGYRPPDIVWDARDGVIPYADSTVDEVYAGYLLLHIYPRYRPTILSEIKRVLTVDGIAVFGEVDMRKVMMRWLKDPTSKVNNELIWGELGDVHGAELEDFDRHTWGFTEESLVTYLREHGFTNCERIQIHHPDVWFELTIRCRKL